METLLSAQNTRKVEKLVRRAAAAEFGRGKARPVFEHDHWWIIIDDADGDEQIFDVVDSYPSVADTGLAFEQVS